jgi:hypothetical protein
MTPRKPPARSFHQSAHYRTEYERGNPVMAWRAFWWARLEGKRVPAWVMDYLEGVASNLLDLAALENARPSNDARIAAALGLKAKGRNTVIRRDRQAIRDAWIVRDVAQARRRGLTVDAAYAVVGDRWNLSDEAIKTICRPRRRR